MELNTAPEPLTSQYKPVQFTSVTFPLSGDEKLDEQIMMDACLTTGGPGAYASETMLQRILNADGTVIEREVLLITFSTPGTPGDAQEQIEFDEFLGWVMELLEIEQIVTFQVEQYRNNEPEKHGAEQLSFLDPATQPHF